MTHNKANKSKILTLILGLATCLALMLGIVFASPTNTARAEETDTRTVVSIITATSNIDDIIGFGKSVKSPSFNIKEDVPAQFQTQYNWEKKTATSWEDYSGKRLRKGLIDMLLKFVSIETAAGRQPTCLTKTALPSR